jgi:N-acetylneuraminate synthase
MKIADREIGLDHPVYFIADIASNHDGDLQRAIDLIYLAAEAGADAAKFQHFRAETIVSDYGFKDLPRASHQKDWEKSVYDTYDQYALPYSWTGILAAVCKDAGIHFLSTPYDYKAVDLIEPYVPAYKIGSGDITWTQFIRYIAKRSKPIILSTGASTIKDVEMAILAMDGMKWDLYPDIALLQCNTNYTGDIKNFKYVNLNVIKSYFDYTDIVGLSDHTPGHAAVLGAVALGARIIEKHFTDDNSREGPDHPFALNPQAWREMVDRTRELEMALGDGEKKIEENEKNTAILQRRCLRATRDITEGELIVEEDIEILRPAPEYSIPPYELRTILGVRANRFIERGEHFSWAILG